MLNVKKPSEAQNIILNGQRNKMQSEQVSILSSINRTLASDIIANEFVPDFNRSTVDGYAVVASDTFGCTESTPAMLKFKGIVDIGKMPNLSLLPGECIYVPTGGEIPQGADAMVMIEYVQDFGDEYRYMIKPSAPGAHIAYKGDDVKPGKKVLQAGRILRPQDIGVLAALGIAKIEVKQKPKVGIISTGNELVKIDEKIKEARVRDINSYTLYTGIEAAGAEPILFGICPDDYETLKEKVRQVAFECDLILISGGSSVGIKDTTQKIIDELSDSGVLFHGIAIKPGKPTIFGIVKGHPVFGLPGHPVSAYFVFGLFVKPLILSMMGAKEQISRKVSANLSTNIPANRGREEYVSVRLITGETGLIAEPVYGKSGMITVLADADGYVKIDRDCEGLMSGAQVDVLLL